MLVFEPIVLFTGIFISLAWSMVFFYFQAYPIIFQRKCLRIMIRIFSNTNFLQRHTTSMLRKHLLHTFQVSKLRLHLEKLSKNLYIAVGIGAASSCLFALFYDAFYEKAKKSGKRWASSPEYHRLPTSCVAGPCLTISLFWLAWSAKSSVHWIVPVLSGLVFGIGYQSIFISLLTYVTDAYRIYSASALASSMILRSIAGALFPLAADPLYAKLGVAWGTSVLGFASLGCIPIPFALLYFGPWIRKQSAFCQRLLEEDLLKSSGARTPQEAEA
jgi:predicted membrane protein